MILKSEALLQEKAPVVAVFRVRAITAELPLPPPNDSEQNTGEPHLQENAPP